MANPDYFKPEFDKLADGGFLGKPDGQPAYAYVRVSTEDQGDEGRTGIPRQLLHVHEKALQDGYRIPWELVFAEDFSGFVLERPELSRLLKALGASSRRADALVIEHLDRLSRNSDWHQGYLLEQLERHLKVNVLFWKSFGSRIERAVMGAVAQEGMEQTKARMADGIRLKALDGRVTSRKRAYGFKIVDDRGEESPRARRFTHYAIFEEEATIVRTIFQRVCCGDTLYRITSDFTDAKIPPPGRYAMWDLTFLRKLINNPVYKGEYAANRAYTGEVQKPSKDGLTMRTVKKTMYRPEEEWILVPVPAIVDDDTWQRANEMLQKNKEMSRRNAKSEYLLTGLLRCAECGYAVAGMRQKENLKGGRRTDYYGYKCATHAYYIRQKAQGIMCHQGYISCRKLDAAVWSAVCQLLLQPETLIAALESSTFNEQQIQTTQQLAFLEKQLRDNKAQSERLTRAYLAGAFDEHEFADLRVSLKDEAERLSREVEKLRPKQITREQFEAQKEYILALSEELNSNGTLVDPPFELKRRILKMLVDTIVVNQREGWFTLTGSIQSRFPLESVSA